MNLPSTPSNPSGGLCLESPWPLPEVLPFRSLAELILADPAPLDPKTPILLGTLGDYALDLGIGQFRAVILDLAEALETKGLRQGQTVALLRLPRTGELPLAIAFATLTCLGIRVLLPMVTEPGALLAWLAAAEADTVLWNAREVQASGTESDRLRLQTLAHVLKDSGIRTLCLQDDLAVGDRIAAAPVTGPEPDDPRLRRLLFGGAVYPECLILTTAGSSGASKLVRYRQEAFLRSCAAWEAAGMFQKYRQGGRGLCLLFSHSMGVRTFWNAMWTKQPICLIPPEWFFEHPERARSLLSRMQPGHVTGGPAVYRALLELVRIFPDLKSTGLSNLRCAVSSGAPFDPELAKAVEAALGIHLHDAFGTSETMQVLSAVAGEGTTGLGKPLPGVSVYLEHVEGDPVLFRLKVRSPFGFAGYLGDGHSSQGDWWATGDLVKCVDGVLSYAGRERDEFVKDGFGVKLSRAAIAARYMGLGVPVTHLEWFPLREEPGLAALIFVESAQDLSMDSNRPLTRRSLLNRIRGLLEARHEALSPNEDEFDSRHFSITRFACLPGPPPRTPKGNVSRGEIENRFRPLLHSLLGSFRQKPGFVRLDGNRHRDSATTRFVQPKVGRMLELLRLDKEYLGGRGDRLLMRSSRGTQEVLDLVGGFGATILGHRHPKVVAAAQRFLESEAVPFADQGSDRPREGALALELTQAVGAVTGDSYVVRFGSTGAEAVEIALTHAFIEREEELARFARQQRRSFGAACPDRVESIIRQAQEAVRQARPRVLALAGSFHGQSQGARAVSHSRRNRGIYAPLAAVETLFLAVEDPVDLAAVIQESQILVPALVLLEGRVEETSRSFSRIIAAIAEPVRGEGGVAIADRRMLEELAAQSFPLILDEIQCGLGRCGSLLASEGVRGAYYLLGKSLGGGLAKISAVLIERGRYVESFDEHYHSTFAGDGFSCTVALETLRVIKKENIPALAASRGEALRQRLEALQWEFPDVVGDIQGRGLMLGINLRPASATTSPLLRAAHEHEHLGLLAASYLLNRWKLRVLPTLSAPNMLRLEPSAFVDDAALGQVEAGLRALSMAIRERDLCELLSPLVEEESRLESACLPESPKAALDGRIEAPAEGATRIAFLNHFVVPERDLAFVEPSLGRLGPAALRALFHRFQGLMDLEPSLLFARNLFGGKVWFASIMIPADPATLEDMHRSGRQAFAVRRIQEALDFGASLGCTVGTLGAYTSIVTDNGLQLRPPPGMKLSTGNALTVAVGASRVLRLCQRRSIDPGSPNTRLGILGATGNIGTALATRLTSGSCPFRQILLVGRQRGDLEALAESLTIASSGLCEVATSTHLTELATCNVIVSATGTNEPLLFTRHFAANRPVILADLSVPSIVAAGVRQLRHVHIVSLAGCVPLPCDPDFAMAPHIRPGTAFSCAGESMLMALDPYAVEDLPLVGPIQTRSVAAMEALACRFGFLDASPMHAQRRGVA